MKRDEIDENLLTWLDEKSLNGWKFGHENEFFCLYLAFLKHLPYLVKELKKTLQILSNQFRSI